MAILAPINYADFDLVTIVNGYVYCKIHGAMNKMNVLEDGGGYYRCLTSVSIKNDTACRAVCVEIRKK
jgi:gamma-glutamylcyclotransferase (GGCT)/AIG2-like uncharacterized protein YtfP